MRFKGDRAADSTTFLTRRASMSSPGRQPLGVLVGRPHELLAGNGGTLRLEDVLGHTHIVSNPARQHNTLKEG